MLNIGFSELLLFGIIALVILGPEKLPTAVRTAGRWYARLRHLVSNLQQDIEKELQLSELREHMQQELTRIKSIEAQMQAQLDQMSDELAELNQSPAAPTVLASAHIYLPISLPISLTSTTGLGVPYSIGHLLRIALLQPYQLTPAQFPDGIAAHDECEHPERQPAAVTSTKVAL